MTYWEFHLQSPDSKDVYSLTTHDEGFARYLDQAFKKAEVPYELYEIGPQRASFGGKAS